jgi:SnoaL-like domain
MAMTVREAFDKGTETFNAHDIDGFTSVLAADAVFRAPGGINSQGKTACAQFYAGWFGAFPDAHTADFDSWTDAHIGVWYGPQAQADAAMARHIQAAITGQPTPPLDPAERLRSAAFYAARTDADIAVALRRMLHLVAGPGEVLGNQAAVSQLRALVNARPELTAAAAGPTRAELAA